MSKIKKVEAREILDSRGNPTIEAQMEFEDGSIGIASVPSGASTGAHEAVELRDGDQKRYKGQGVLKAIENVNSEINNAISGKDFDQKSLDNFLIELDGTKNKSRLGANAILSVSLSFARTNAKEKNIELYEYLGGLAGDKDFKLPQPMFNIINGGKHADSGLDIQEFMLGPRNFSSFKEKVRVADEVISSLKNILEKKGFGVGIGDEGGFAPKLSSNEEALDLILEAIKDAGYSQSDFALGIDSASSSFFENGKYKIKINGEKKELQKNELLNWYRELILKYPIISIEDGFSEDDFEGFAEMKKELGDKIKIVGDDLLVTNIERIKIAIEKNSVNSVLIKLNQIGTLSETIEAIELTKKQNWAPFISHRSGETTDTFIADLAVGFSCDFIKAGSLRRGERIAKYNRLIEIEENLSK